MIANGAKLLAACGRQPCSFAMLASRKWIRWNAYHQQSLHIGMLALSLASSFGYFVGGNPQSTKAPISSSGYTCMHTSFGVWDFLSSMCIPPYHPSLYESMVLLGFPCIAAERVGFRGGANRFSPTLMYRYRLLSQGIVVSLGNAADTTNAHMYGVLVAHIPLSLTFSPFSRRRIAPLRTRPQEDR